MPIPLIAVVVLSAAGGGGTAVLSYFGYHAIKNGCGGDDEEHAAHANVHAELIRGQVVVARDAAAAVAGVAARTESIAAVTSASTQLSGTAQTLAQTSTRLEFIAGSVRTSAEQLIELASPMQATMSSTQEQMSTLRTALAQRDRELTQVRAELTTLRMEHSGDAGIITKMEAGYVTLTRENESLRQSVAEQTRTIAGLQTELQSVTRSYRFFKQVIEQIARVPLVPTTQATNMVLN